MTDNIEAQKFILAAQEKLKAALHDIDAFEAVYWPVKGYRGEELSLCPHETITEAKFHTMQGLALCGRLWREQ